MFKQIFHRSFAVSFLFVFCRDIFYMSLGLEVEGEETERRLAGILTEEEEEEEIERKEEEELQIRFSLQIWVFC